MYSTLIALVSTSYYTNLEPYLKQLSTTNQISLYSLVLAEMYSIQTMLMYNYIGIVIYENSLAIVYILYNPSS